MITFLRNKIFVFAALFIFAENIFGQCITNPSVSAGSNTTICLGQCANLNAAVLAPPPNATTNYSFAQVGFTTFPFSGGNNAFANSLDDTWSDVIDIGFNFCYFGNSFNKVVVGSNGEITFDQSVANQPENWPLNQVLPNLTEHPGNTICAAYRDYNPLPGGVIRTYSAGVAPCRRFVIYWSNVTLFSCSTPLSSFQIVLFESTNRIGINIVNSTACLPWNNGRGLLGIQNAAGNFAVAPPTRNTLTPWTAINESWLFTPTAAPSFSVSWAGPNGFTANGLTAAPCPTSTSNYTATMAYCGGSVTSAVQVVVGNPTVNATASSNTICPPQNATLTGSGATTYTWVTPSGTFFGPSLVVSPLVNTTYTLLGTSGVCTNSTTIPITIGIPPVLNAFNLSGTICSGSSANAIVTGALNYTWNPGGIVGNIVNLSPAVTTTYTVTGNSGGCNATTTLVIPVSNGPTMTAVASPTAICPGNSATLSATGALSYTWNPGGVVASSIVVNPLTTTLYTVTGINAVGCTSTLGVNLIVNPIPNLTITPASPSICIGNTANLIASGATSYTWNPGGLTTAAVLVSPLVSTTYTIIGSNGTCTNSTTSLLTVVPIPTVTASSSTNQICAGSSVNLNGFGATTYTWNPGNLVGSSVNDAPLVTTTYTVIGSTATCTNSAQVTVTVNNGPVITSVAAPTGICAGNSATLSSSGAVSYTWNPGALPGASIVVNPPVTTVFSVTGENALGCTTTETVNLTVTPLPLVTAAAAPATICVGQSATLTGNGATTYAWNPGNLIGTNITVSPLVNTQYTVTGSTAGCSAQNTVDVVVLGLPVVSASASNQTICAGETTTLSGSGASSYTWNPGNLVGTNVNVTPLVSTTYTVIGSNGSCSSSNSIAITVNPLPTILPSASPATICAGASSTLSATGAVSFTWNPGGLIGSPQTVTPLTTTIYTVSGTNALGCINNQTVSLTVNPIPLVGGAAAPATICVGGTSTLTGSGATTYTWNPGNLIGTSVNVSPLVTTQYTVLGSNAGCSAQNTVEVTVQPSPLVNASATSATICAGQTTTLTGSGALTYTWNPGNLTGTSVNVSPAISTVYTVTGNNGICSATNVIAITVNPLPIIIPAASPTNICVGASSTLTATGALNYTWNPGALTGSNVTVSPLTTTNFTVTGANAAGCSNTAVVTVSVNSLPVLVLAANPSAICVGATATLSGLGATSYTWNPGTITGANVTVSPVATTIYTATGANGSCATTETVLLTVNSNPVITANATPTAICSGNSTTLSALGALTFTWNPGNLIGANQNVTPLTTTNFTVIGTNASGCAASAVVVVSVTPTPTVNASASAPTICAGQSTTITPSGATIYTLNPGGLIGTSFNVSPLVTTVFTITGSNGNCVGTRTINITVNPLPPVAAIANPVAICAGATSTLTGSGAVSYTWNPGNLIGTTVTVSPISTTVYTVTGSNAFGCTNTNTTLLTVNPLPTITATGSPTNICVGSSSTLSATGGISFVWNPGGIIGSPVVVSPTVTTTYTVFGTNAFGCFNTTLLTISVTPNPTLIPVATPTAICVGQTATLSSTGATIYTWNPGLLTGSSVTVSPLATTLYTVTGANGICSSTNILNLVVNPLPVIVASGSPTQICAGASTTLSATGALSFTWNPGALIGSNVTVSPAASTIFTVTGVNANGCLGTRTVNIIVNPNPTLNIIASATNICSGSSATLTGSALPLGPITSTWLPSGTLGNVLVVSPTSNTTFTWSATTAAGCSGTRTISINVSTLALSASVIGPNPICVGATATLAGFGATSYSWNPGGLIGGTVNVSPISTTNFTLIGVNGACTQTLPVTVSVSPTPTVTLNASSTNICSGNSTTLTASGVVNFTWNPGNITGTNSIIVNPTSTTIYTLTGASLAGCIGSNTIQINVTPTPSVTASVSNPSICLGGTSTLTANGATSYTWLPTLANGSTTVVSPLVNTTFTVIGANGICTSTQTVNVSVSNPPVLIAGGFPNPICAGETASLGATGAINYTWNPGGLTGSLVLVSPTITTNYTVTGANLNGCSSTSVVSIVVNPIPTITVNNPTSAICIGTTLNLTASGASSYTWQPGNLTGASQNLSPTSNTTYTVLGLTATGCSNTAVFTITVTPAPVVFASSSPTAVCPGGSSTLTAFGATNYTWLPSGITGTSTVVTPTITETYTLIGSNSGCTNTAQSIITVSVLPTSLVFIVPGSGAQSCSGASFTMTAFSDPGSTYTWTPPTSTGSVLIVNPTVTTIYTLDVTNTFGCNTSVDYTLNVVPLPNITISSLTSSICAGSSATLVGNGGSTYSWSPTASNSQTISVSPTATTIYTLVGTEPVLSCTNFATYTLNVLPASLTITPSSNPICAGNSVTLGVTGATSYTWLPSNLTTTLIVESPTSNTTYTVIGDNGICTLTQTIGINVNPNPTVTASISNTQVCSGSSVVLTGSGASNYTWNPIGLTGNTVVTNPTTNTTYTVIGATAGCTSTAFVSVSITPGPIVTVTPSSTIVCLGNSATLTVSGAISYTWNPSTLTGTSVVVSPTVTSTYTVSGEDGSGSSCINTQTITLPVFTSPTVTVASSATAICQVGSVTLTATGANSYTWEPGTNFPSSISVSPTVTTEYTVTGANASCGTSSAVITITVNSLPTASASVSSTISCTTPSVSLIGASSSTNTAYFWNGPFGFVSSAQSPSGIAIPGNYILSVTDINTGCTNFTAVAVTSDSTIPTIQTTVNGEITCANTTATISATTTATNAGYFWSGPGTFTSSLTTETVSVGGNYTLTITDLTNSCPASTIVVVNTNTTVPITATLLPATCNGTTTNNDGTILAANFVSGDRYDFVVGLTYTGTATFATASVIPVSGIVTNTLANPCSIIPITVRWFGLNGCTKDTTMFLVPTSCVTNTIFGIAKGVSTPTLQSNGTYNVNYKIVVKNYTSSALNNVVLYEDLSQTFPLPTTYSLISGPSIITAASGLTLEPAFTGSLQTLLTNTLSVLNANTSDTIVFGLNINPNGKFGPFNNTVIGFSQVAPGVLVSDSSNTGLDPDPDLDGNPGNNNLPTPLNLTPNLFFGLTKQGVISEKLSDGSYDISYTITVHNRGNDTLKNVMLKDTLFNKAVKQPATYTIKNGPIATGSLIANSSYNGNSNVDLITSSLSVMPPNVISSVSFTINVLPDTVTVFKNSAHGTAISAALGSTVTDVSNDGNNPDSNNNGVWNEAADNVATILTIKSNTLFVPEGFTPNGDNKNDTWVIKGLPSGNKVTVYNRWGSKVYEKTEYDNSWNGFANVGATLGSNKLPQGTYYYIVEFNDGSIKPLNGFLILQY